MPVILEGSKMKIVSAPVEASTLSEANIKIEYENDFELWSSVLELAMLESASG